jgi:hypothetical protein
VRETFHPVEPGVPPRPGTEVQVVVQRLNAEDGLYELSLPNKAVQVDDWSDLVEGVLVEVRVTGHNTGGLECEVNHIRGFIPISQVSLYRVEDLAQFVGEMNFVNGTAAAKDRVDSPMGAIAAAVPKGVSAGAAVTLSIRPEHVQVYAAPSDGAASTVGKVSSKIISATLRFWRWK